MSVSRISEVVVWQFMHDVSGDFELSMECVVLKRISVVFWELQRFLELRGCWEVVMLGLADSALNFCPIFKTKPC
jgi:hypothetical protein